MCTWGDGVIMWLRLCGMLIVCYESVKVVWCCVAPALPSPSHPTLNSPAPSPSPSTLLVACSGSGIIIESASWFHTSPTIDHRLGARAF